MFTGPALARGSSGFAVPLSLGGDIYLILSSLLGLGDLLIDLDPLDKDLDLDTDLDTDRDNDLDGDLE